MAQTSQTPRALVLFIAALGLAFITLGILSVPKDLALNRSHSVTTAKVIEWREMESPRNGTSHDVRYVFSPAPGQPEIGRSDCLGRSALWSSLPVDQWKAAIETGSIQVRFDPSDPGNNAPETSLPSGWDDTVPFILGLIALGSAIAMGRTLKREQRHRRLRR
jgi:hypothetical protein